MNERPQYYAIHVNAQNDINGNPRRAFMVYDSAGAFVGSVDEGYGGKGVLERYGKDVDIHILAEIPTTVGFYRDLTPAMIDCF